MSAVVEDRAPEGSPTIELLRRIRSGALSARTLDTPSRRGCVECLLAEGRTVSEIAAILCVSDRTVSRDKREIASANALRWDPALVPELIGELKRRAEQTRAGLLRVARDPACGHGARIKAERAAWRVDLELFKTLQSVGYIPQAPTRIEAELMHTQGMSFDEMGADIDRVSLIYAEAKPDDGEGAARLGRARREVARLAAPADKDREGDGDARGD